LKVSDYFKIFAKGGVPKKSKGGIVSKSAKTAFGGESRERGRVMFR